MAGLPAEYTLPSILVQVVLPPHMVVTPNDGNRVREWDETERMASGQWNRNLSHFLVRKWYSLWSEASDDFLRVDGGTSLGVTLFSGLWTPGRGGKEGSSGVGLSPGLRPPVVH